MSYTARTQDQLLALKINANIEQLLTHDRYGGAGLDDVEAIAQGIGAFATGEWAPLNRIGDSKGATVDNGIVRLPDGFDAAYQAYVGAGWNSISGRPEFGGQGLPMSLSACVLENLGTANMAFALLPMLSVGAIEALDHHGSDSQKAVYLEKLISGEWSGTMNLTEPNAGSDVGALRSTAVPITDGPHAGKYKIKGTKIFITWGEHDLAANIVHLVLARLPDAPAGPRGISLFLVPKYHVEPDGSQGARNDVKIVSLEYKLGIHASPTCVMSFGDDDVCIGELVGAENDGLKCMFTMMNNARINVGSQGVQIAERATQQAVAYAKERIQSPRAGSADKSPVAIIEHPDVRRMLLRMRSLTDAGRALLYFTCGQMDAGILGDMSAGKRAELLVPMLKAWGTDMGCEVASLGVQVHGGMGFIEETGAAQYYRDARIAPIYEGTNGIQAADLVTRKLAMDGGAVLTDLMADIMTDCNGAPALKALAATCADLAIWMRDVASLDDKLAGSVPFCTMCATAVAGWQLHRQAQAVAGSDAPEAKAKQAACRYFLTNIVPEAQGLEASASPNAADLFAQDGDGLFG